VVCEAPADGGMSIQQSGADRAARPSLAIYAPISAINATVRARFKLIDGSTPSAGIALHVTSPDDYYLVRASAQEQRFALLHVVHGATEGSLEWMRTSLRTAETLEVDSRGNGFTIWLDDRSVLTAFDTTASSRRPVRNLE
jgi:hypothetical protein